MPCYQVQTASVNLNKADHGLLAKAMTKLGYKVVVQGKSFSFSKGSVSGSYANDKLSFSAQNGAEIDSDAVKRAYSEQVVHQKAAEYAEKGWEMEQDGDEYVFRRQSGYGAVYA